MLFEAERHEKLVESVWDETRAREAIARIVAEAERVFDPQGLWPVHTLDGSRASELIRRSLYLGAAGVIWAIDYLTEQGAVQSVRDWTPIAAALSASDAGASAREERLRDGLMLGRTGVALAAYRVTREAAAVAQVLAAAGANLAHESNEIFAGTPGTLLAAQVLFEQTADPRLRDLVRESADRVLAELRFEPEHGAALWTQHYFGPMVKFVGLGHGFVGNVCVLLRAGRERELAGEIARTLESAAIVEGELANWPYCVGAAPPGRTSLLVQLCHGAPGVIVGLARFAAQKGSRLEALLLAGGALAWRAGPLAKGSNLCHGTAGNGYAFLSLYRRTGERVWLERARAFAMHAIAQQEAEHARHGRGRFSLWTGDPGLACFLWDCVRERDEFPTLHVF